MSPSRRVKPIFDRHASRVSADHGRTGPPPAQAGFSILEAIVILMIGGMILSAVLPIVMQSTAQNLRLGKKALGSVEAILEESAFRALMQSAAPPAQSSLGRPARVTIRGDANSLSLVSLNAQPLACAKSLGEIPVTLVIEGLGSNAGGQLVCRSEEASRTLATWPAGRVSLAYSSDGKSWADKWPSEADEARWERDLVATGATSGAPLISAPLVKLEFDFGNSNSSVWIERAGSIEPVSYDVDTIFLDGDRPEQRF